MHPRKIEKAFVQVMIDLHAIVVLDGVDGAPEGWVILSHDLHGPLPSIEIGDNGNRSTVLEMVGREACKLYAISRIREEISRAFPGFSFLLPTLTEQGAGVGVSNGTKTILAEGENFLEAYRALRSKSSS